MKCLGIRPLFLCLVFGLQGLLLWTTSVGALKASSIFDSPPSGKDGSCASKDVDTMVTEAVTLAQNAITALDILLAPDIPYNDKNEILANTAMTYWGIRWSKSWFRKTINIKSGTDTLGAAKKNLELVTDKLMSNSVDGARLVCDEKDWRWITKLGDIGLDPADQLIADYRKESVADNPGYYLSKSYPNVMVPSEPLNNGYGGGLCTDSSADGITWALSKFIMMCNRAFDSHSTTLSSMISGQDGIASGTSIDNMQTAGAIFLHEMMHWINQNIIDVVVTLPNGIKTKAYGFDLCAGIANRVEYTGKAVKNADNYRSFAMSMILDKIDWSQGEKP